MDVSMLSFLDGRRDTKQQHECDAQLFITQTYLHKTQDFLESSQGFLELAKDKCPQF